MRSDLLPEFRGRAGFLCLAVLVVLAYGPSLWHGPRGDQINYLAELAARRGFLDTVLGTFDLNRTRAFGAGDELAFRPVLYIILGLQKYLFGYGFMAWQAVGLAAHLLTCGALYALLYRIRGGLFAFLGTGLFAFAVVNIEAVVWHHITPYLVFAGCVLMALRALYIMEHDAVKARAQAFAALGWMVPAVFLYETGVWYALCMGVFLWWRGQRVAGMAAGALIVLYAGLNLADLLWRHADAMLQVGEIAGKGGFLLTLGNAVLLGKWFLSAFYFLASADLSPVSRMMVRPELLSWPWPWGQPFSLPLLSGLVLLAVTGMFLVWRAAAGVWRKDSVLLVLGLAMAAGYLLVIAAGRINVLGVFGMRVGLYYAYNFLVLAFVAAALVAGKAAVWRGVWGRPLKFFGAGIILLVILFNALTVHKVVAQMARDHHVNLVFLQALDRFVKAHAQEPGFSFYATAACPGNYTADWVSRRGDPAGRTYTVAEALYPLQFKRDHPKYVIKSER